VESEPLAPLIKAIAITMVKRNLSMCFTLIDAKCFYFRKSTNIFPYAKHHGQEYGKKSVLVPCGDVNHAIYVRKTEHWHEEIKIKSLTLLRKAMCAHMTGACA
jgi:hypothetical protein